MMHDAKLSWIIDTKSPVFCLQAISIFCQGVQGNSLPCQVYIPLLFIAAISSTIRNYYNKSLT